MTKRAILWLSLSVATLMNAANACTDVQITAKDNTRFIARSMEFATDMQANIRTSTQDREYLTSTPDGKAALSWKAKYGYVYLDGLNQDFTFDGLNQYGLSFEYLYLPGETQYSQVPVGKEAQSLPYYYLGDWILSNFKTVDEVKQALANLYVFAQAMPGMENVILPAHAAIHDPSGKGIVVEFVKGKMQISDFVGVMTNSPPYQWQVTNLRNYLNLSPYNPNAVSINGIVYAATGQGAGMIGLPGDVSPPSRFVKTAFLAKNAFAVDDAAGALNLTQHIINNVDIPAGLARSKTGDKESSDTTQWVVFKDLTHQIIYYRSYTDLTLRSNRS